MDEAVLLPYRPNDSSGPAKGGILDGLDDMRGGSGLDLFLTPEEISGIDDLVYRPGERTAQDSEPRLLEARDNNLSDAASDKSSGSHSNRIVEGDQGSVA